MGSPTPTMTPSPTPTPTPIPPAQVRILRPDRISAVQPALIQAELVPPPGVSMSAVVTAMVFGPTGGIYEEFRMDRVEDYLYTSDGPLLLPLKPAEGEWRIALDVKSTLGVQGDTDIVLEPETIHFRDLTNVLPAGTTILVPVAFKEVRREGDEWAGGRAWEYQDTLMELWWVPGPLEPLQLDGAITVLEATHEATDDPAITSFEKTEWDGQIAFEFVERWQGGGEDVGTAVVVQAPDFWLYVMRMRAARAESVPAVVHEVWRTFSPGGD
jgi:hypothetical protein